MYIKNQKFLILGVSKSGFSSAEYLLNRGAICYLYEDLKSKKICEAIEQLTLRGAIKVEKEEVDTLLDNIDVVVISPGVPINNEIAVLAKQKHKRIIGEFEFAYLAMMPTFIAVTGTNGKTTTVSLINAILEKNGDNCKMVGNCGIPLSSKINEIDRETLCVAELSSFQFEGINSFCPHVACITNIAPDHLERHYNMENYIYLKKRIFQNQKQSEYTVLNYDDNIVRGLASSSKAKVVYVSLSECVNGGYMAQGKLYYNGEYIMDESELSLKGNHNVYDALFAITCAKLVGVNNEIIRDTLKSFKGVRHRVEFVCEKNGIKFYNDSKATNTSSTISAIDSMKAPTVLLLGGSEKGENYVELFEKIKASNVKQVVMFGASKFNMAKDAEQVKFDNYSIVSDFKLAIKLGYMFATCGDNVLLSPACASFDCFSSYEERGDVFCKEVEQLT